MTPDRSLVALFKSMPLPEQFVVGLALGAGLHRLHPRGLPMSPTVAGVVGRSMVAAGIGLMVSGWRARGWWNDLERPDGVVTDGAYRLTRNPMYVGMALVHLGVAVATRSGWIAATWLPAMRSIHRDILREERALAAQFDGEYDRYRRSVPRYLGHADRVA